MRPNTSFFLCSVCLLSSGSGLGCGFFGRAFWGFSADAAGMRFSSQRVVFFSSGSFLSASVPLSVSSSKGRWVRKQLRKARKFSLSRPVCPSSFRLPHSTPEQRAPDKPQPEPGPEEPESGYRWPLKSKAVCVPISAPHFPAI